MSRVAANSAKTSTRNVIHLPNHSRLALLHCASCVSFEPSRSAPPASPARSRLRKTPCTSLGASTTKALGLIAPALAHTEELLPKPERSILPST